MAARIPLPQKIILTVLLCSGVFVVICAILRAYYSVTDISTFSTALGWASRECFVSVIIVSAPGIKPLFSRFKWFRSKVSTNEYSYSKRSKLQGSMLNSKKGHNFNTLISGDNHELSSGIRRHKHGSSNESQEQIISSSVTAKHDDHVEPGENTGIQVTTDVTLEHEDAQSGTRGHPRF
ncbi:hypothetical protein PHISCL_06253 [Aspergillus sclerotialis]|uniref:Rhodopsin domain-containing protein n=1 Tax=Aspergillus sclerotialis TaxID=2070753 RepID=A0A3A2ZE40_9EURO|nr:hypothetical protein PHISCL_06253 [Aspergillus sclerotialis]